MLWSHWILLAVCFGFSALTSYIDLDSELKSKKIAYLLNRSAYLFIFLNGFVSVGLLFWAYWGGESALIAKAIQVESPVAQMLVISLATPLIIRSKLFSHTDFEAGPAQIYNWYRGFVLFQINLQSGQTRLELAAKFSERLSRHKNPFEMIRDLVVEINKVKSPDEQDRELQRLEEVRTNASGLSAKEQAKLLIRFALDSTQHIRLVENYLEETCPK